MTSVVVWVGVDTHGPASAYIATDSRFSWGTSRKAQTWDLGRKTFASTVFADIAGYWGDVLFPVVALSQFFSSLDAGLVAAADSTSDERFGALEAALRVAQAAMPTSQQRGFTVVHAARDGEGTTSTFVIRTLSWSSSSGWSRDNVPMPHTSAAVQLGGSGAGTTKVHLAEWNATTEGGTSRAVYSAFVDGLLAESDPYSGGGPQLVGLYRILGGRSFGTVVGRHRYFHGAPVTTAAKAPHVEWRNELFERVSGDTRRRLAKAKRHQRPVKP